jgi:hypothetical protein
MFTQSLLMIILDIVQEVQPSVDDWHLWTTRGAVMS